MPSHNSPIRALTLSTAFICGCCLVCADVRAQTFDWNAFDRTTNGDKLALVLAGLRDHAAALNNAEFRIKATSAGSHAGATEAVVSAMQINLRTLGSQYRCDFEYVMPRRTGGEYKEILRVSWGGQRFKVWSSIAGNPYPSGIISNRERSQDSLRWTWWFTDQLGTRRQPPGTGETVADWIQLMVENRDEQYEIVSVRAAERSLIKLKLIHPPSQQSHEYLIDPSRQFVIKRYGFFRRRPDGELRTYADVTTDALIDAGGVSVPSRVTRKSFLPSGELASTTEYELLECTLGQVTEEDIALLAFEAETRVIDEDKQVAYVVKEDGTDAALPLLNPSTGQVTGGPSTQATASTMETPVSSSPIAFGMADKSGDGFSARYWLVFAGTVLGVLGIVAGFLLLRSGGRAA